MTAILTWRLMNSLTYALGLSDRPVGVKRFQTIPRCHVDVACGLVLHFGISAPIALEFRKLAGTSTVAR